MVFHRGLAVALVVLGVVFAILIAVEPQVLAFFGGPDAVKEPGVGYVIAGALAGAGAAYMLLVWIFDRLGRGDPAPHPLSPAQRAHDEAVRTQRTIEHGFDAVVTLASEAELTPSPNVPNAVALAATFSISIDGGEPYEVRHSMLAPEAVAAELVPGAVLPARIDPSDPTFFLVDWDRFTPRN